MQADITPQSMFVYGTLRRDMGYPLLTPHEPIPIGVGSTPGKMFSLGGYPGAIPSDESVIQGQLLSYEHLNEKEWNEVLKVVDYYEGSSYEREIVEVSLSDGTITEAWMYFNIHDDSLPRRCPHIPSGDWKEWKES